MNQSKVICNICQREFSQISGFTKHLIKTHSYTEKQLEQYALKYIHKDTKCSIDGCDNIVDILEHSKLRIIYQKKCNEHISKCHRRLECPDCREVIGLQQMRKHLIDVHSYDEQMLLDYCKEHVISADKYTCSNPNCNNETELYDSKEGKNNPLNTFKLCFNKYCPDHYDRTYSATTREYWKNRGLTEIETDKKLKDISKKVSKGVKKATASGDILHSQLGYWLKKTNGDEVEAKRLLSERQTTFSKEKCIEKYGKEKGTKRWQKRQDKWLETLDCKSEEEKTRIAKAKMCNGKSYSKISQELFTSLYKKIKDDEVYFATKHNDGVHDNGENKEYCVFTNNGRLRFLDFYIPSKKKCIEFDGQYFHSEKFFKGNKERDRIREEDIKDAVEGIEILHIPEEEYKSNPELVIENCINFIKSI